MTNTQPQLAPEFEGVYMPHDGIALALTQIKTTQLLPAEVAQKVLKGTPQYPYAQLTQPDGRPFLEWKDNSSVKRCYVFVDKEEPFNASRMVAMLCSVTLNSGVIVALPERIYRGPEADFIMSVRYGCCSGGRTMIYSDTSQSRGVFMNIGSSGGDVRAEIRQVWNRLQAIVLDNQGMQALQQMALVLVGRAQGTVNLNTWKGAALRLQ